MKPRVAISPLCTSDGAEFIAAAFASRKLHAPWVAPPLTPATFSERLDRLVSPHHYAFAVRGHDDGALVGCVEVTQVVRGSLLSAYLAYYAFAGHERRGLMTEGLRLVIRHAFGDLGLHRLEANIQPGNMASIALVRTCGFAREGYSPRYLKVRGRWRDHERWAILAS